MYNIINIYNIIKSIIKARRQYKEHCPYYWCNVCKNIPMEQFPEWGMRDNGRRPKS